MTAVWEPTQPPHLAPFESPKHHSVSFGESTTQLDGHPFHRAQCPPVGWGPSDDMFQPFRCPINSDYVRVATGHEQLYPGERKNLCRVL